MSLQYNTKQHQNNKNKPPISCIKISKHAEQRISERLEIKFSNTREKQIFFYKARFEGIALGSVSLRDLGGDKELYNYFLGHYRTCKGTRTIRLYKGYIFVFAGEQGRVLKTLFPAPVV